MDKIVELLQDKNIRKKYHLPAHKITTNDIDTVSPDWRKSARENKWWESHNIQNAYHYLKRIMPQDVEVDSETCMEYARKYQKRYVEFLALHYLLLEVGGQETCFPSFCEDIVDILTRGRYCPGHSKMMKGRPSQCHSNVAELWDINHEYHDVNICTGFALSDDGIWREHSWLVHRYSTGKQHRTRIIETTEKRLAYFGYELTDDEAYKFVEDNP